MGIFGRNIQRAYGTPDTLALSSPWAPSDALERITIDALLSSDLKETLTAGTIIGRDAALRIPAVSRAHGLAVGTFGDVTFWETDANGQRTANQPEWLINSQSGVSPYHRKLGLASDWFFEGWACLGFTSDLSDALHIPYGMWSAHPDGTVYINAAGADVVASRYRSHLVAIPVGYGWNGLLNDGAETIRDAQLISGAYRDRLANPVPLTVLSVPREVWAAWTPEERKEYRDQYVEGRKAANGAVVTKVAEFPIEFPNTEGVDLYESGRNANRLDIANHTSTPASLLEGTRQAGGGGMEVRYSGVANGQGRPEFWDYGLAKRFMRAFEARLSLDDISGPGLSIRGDAAGILDIPSPTTTDASEA